VEVSLKVSLSTHPVQSKPILDTSMSSAKESQTHFIHIPDGPATAEIALKNGTVTGFGVTGFWGAGMGVEPPHGDCIEERAEIWFARQQ
jgi:hypothetical protein